MGVVRPKGQVRGGVGPLINHAPGGVGRAVNGSGDMEKGEGEREQHEPPDERPRLALLHGLPRLGLPRRQPQRKGALRAPGSTAGHRDFTRMHTKTSAGTGGTAGKARWRRLIVAHTNET